MSDAPESFRKFMKLIKDQLYYLGGDIVIFDEPDLLKTHFSQNEIRSMCRSLENRGLTTVCKVRWGLKSVPIPTKTKWREKYVGHFDWAWLSEHMLKLQYVIRFTSAEAFLRFYETETQTPLQSLPALTQLPSGISKPNFNLAKGKIEMGIKDCTIPMNSNQYILCQKLFAVPFGHQVPSLDISEDEGWSSESGSGVYDTLRAINRKVKESFGIEPFILWDKEYLSINEKLFAP